MITEYPLASERVCKSTFINLFDLINDEEEDEASKRVYDWIGKWVAQCSTFKIEYNAKENVDLYNLALHRILMTRKELMPEAAKFNIEKKEISLVEKPLIILYFLFLLRENTKVYKYSSMHIHAWFYGAMHFIKYNNWWEGRESS